MNKLQTGWLYTLTGAVSAVSLAACMPASKPYNIVYIMTDDHTAQMMSCYDNRYIENPYNSLAICYFLLNSCALCQ